jgi:hypothetical protein
MALTLLKGMPIMTSFSKWKICKRLSLRFLYVKPDQTILFLLFTFYVILKNVYLFNSFNLFSNSNKFNKLYLLIAWQTTLTIISKILIVAENIGSML